jgi:hypothetical protein
MSLIKVDPTPIIVQYKHKNTFIRNGVAMSQKKNGAAEPFIALIYLSFAHSKQRTYTSTPKAYKHNHASSAVVKIVLCALGPRIDSLDGFFEFVFIKSQWPQG